MSALALTLVSAGSWAQSQLGVPSASSTARAFFVQNRTLCRTPASSPALYFLPQHHHLSVDQARAALTLTLASLPQARHSSSKSDKYFSKAFLHAFSAPSSPGHVLDVSSELLPGFLTASCFLSNPGTSPGSPPCSLCSSGHHFSTANLPLSRGQSQTPKNGPDLSLPSPGLLSLSLITSSDIILQSFGFISFFVLLTFFMLLVSPGPSLSSTCAHTLDSSSSIKPLLKPQAHTDA